MKSLTKVTGILFTIYSICFMGCEKSNTLPPGGDYSVLAWNDLGMHCLNPTYDKLVVLPPYNNVMVQVIKRGNPPEVVTSGITVEYKLIDNTSSYNKRAYGKFWDNSNKLFGVTLTHDIGLAGFGLSGKMETTGNYFIGKGIPVVPVYDNGTWDPYQVAEITVKDGGEKVIAQTRTTIPTSDEMNCVKCHGTTAFDDILTKHDSKHETNLSVIASQPHCKPLKFWFQNNAGVTEPAVNTVNVRKGRLNGLSSIWSIK